MLTYSMRPMLAVDEPFLYRVYASTREEELKQVPWSEEQKTEFLKMQHQAQHTYYQEVYDKATYEIICTEGKDIGRLYVDRREEEICIVDIALLPEYRRHGIGTRILKNLLKESDERGVALRIHVEFNNPALALYKRLGFKKIEDKDIYWLMEYKNH